MLNDALHRSYIEQIVEQVAHRHQLSQNEKNQLCNIVLESLSRKVRIPDQHKEAFHDATVMLQSAGYLDCNQEMRSAKDRGAGIGWTNPPTGHAGQERRRYPRLVVNWPLTINTPGGPVAGVMKDISAGGAFVRGQESFQLDAQLSLTDIHLRSSKLRLSIGAKVIRSSIHYIDDETVSLGMGVRFTRLSAEAQKLIATLISGYARDEIFGPRTDLERPTSKNNQRAETESQLVRLEIDPISYPLVGLSYRNHADDDLEAHVSFSRELWINTARACGQIAYGMGTSSSKKVRAALSLMAERILSEIEAEDKRLRYKESYEAFFNSVVEIYNQKDLDRVRRSQMIHDLARQVKLQP